MLVENKCTNTTINVDALVAIKIDGVHVNAVTSAGIIKLMECESPSDTKEVYRVIVDAWKAGKESVVITQKVGTKEDIYVA